jgi:sulfotransferase
MMADKQKIFLTGLPRSGTTLLTSILNQNPDVYASPNSALCQILWDTQLRIFNDEQFRAYPNYQGALNILTSLADNYYKDQPQKIIIDKCRDWGVPPNQRITRLYIDDNPKYIIVVRNVLDVLASFITLLNKKGQNTGYFDNEIGYTYRSLDDARCDFLMKPNGLTQTIMLVTALLTTMR